MLDEQGYVRMAYPVGGGPSHPRSASGVKKRRSKKSEDLEKTEHSPAFRRKKGDPKDMDQQRALGNNQKRSRP